MSSRSRFIDRVTRVRHNDAWYNKHDAWYNKRVGSPRTSAAFLRHA
jgi:hypothetical protein